MDRKAHFIYMEDWQAIYVDGVKIFEDHQIGDFRLAEILIGKENVTSVEAGSKDEFNLAKSAFEEGGITEPTFNKCPRCGSLEGIGTTWRLVDGHWEHRCADLPPYIGHFVPKYGAN